MLWNPGMIWKPLANRVKRTVSQPESALLLELASGAVLLAWVVRWVVE